MDPYQGSYLYRACDNDLRDFAYVAMTAHRIDNDGSAGSGTRSSWRVLKWLVVSLFVALLAYFAFRGYVSPDLLFHFSSSFYC